MRALRPGASLRDLRAALGAEVAAQGERWVLWTPVAFGAGSAAYFALKREPALGLAALLVLAAASAALAARLCGARRAALIWTALAVFASTGFAAARLSTRLAAAPVVPQDLGAVHVEGWVVDVASPSQGRARLLLAPSSISHLGPAQTPARMRLTLKSGEPPAPGAMLEALAIVNPPPGPAAPGAYDFARDAWFDRIGAVGLALAAPVTVRPDAPPGWPLRAEMALNAFRWRLARRLAQDITALTGEQAGAGLAAAVTTSHQDWLDPDDADDLRTAGLAHMLAIAGLHTAAVTGFVFIAIRLAVASWPWLALRVSGKKLAAAGGLLATLAYLAISGAHPPARRAAITAAVAFVAILCDRRAISLRSLAVAALVVLALQPVAVVEPGFEMSFCATAALVALAERWPHRAGRLPLPWYVAGPQRLKDWLLAMLTISFVAGAATGPFAIQHFNRMASYGLFANLAADFLASALMMPSLALAAVGEAAGADPRLLSPFLLTAGWSGKAILAVAHLFATAPGASRAFASAPWPALVLSYGGIVFACLWKGRLRWCAAPLAAAVLLWPRPPPPAAWIAADGDNAAIVADGRAVVLKPHVRRFASDAWASRRGLTLPAVPDAEADLAFDCNRNRCIPRYGVTPSLGAWWSRRAPTPGQLDELCRASDVVILRASVATSPACDGRLVLGPGALARGGGAELYPAPGAGWRLVWAADQRGLRPWTAAAPPRLNGSGG